MRGAGGRLFPVLDADLTLAPAGQNAASLRLDGTYRPPLGSLGAELDRLLLHRVAEATIHNFLERVAAALAQYDVSSNDMLTWWEQDGLTRLAVLYVESFGSPRKFARTARRVGRRMPVLTVISGRSAAGQRAAASHTAAAATPLVTQEALFAQAGIIACRSLGELTAAAALLASQPLPAGHRVAVISNAGGAGVLAADACGDHGLQVATLSRSVQRKLNGLLPPGAAVAGPVDTTAAVSVDAFRSALEEIAADEEVDAVLAVTVPTAIADLSEALRTARYQPRPPRSRAAARRSDAPAACATPPGITPGSAAGLRSGTPRSG